MASIPPHACIASDSDIAGIGVRVSVYIQTLLNLLCAIIFARDGHITAEEASVLAESTKNLCLTCCAILLTAGIQSATTGLSVYHALIVLNLSWLNALSAVVFHALVINHAHRTSPRLREPIESSPTNVAVVRRPGFLQRLSQVFRRTRKMINQNHRPTLILAIISFCGMGAFGLALWHNIASFGSKDQIECTPQLFLPIFGHGVAVMAPSLRKLSLAVYSISVAPFYMVLYLSSASMLLQNIFTLFWKLVKRYRRASSNIPPPIAKGTFFVCGVAMVAMAEASFIVDTELMISRSAHLVEEGEDKWTFGQTLAMVLVLVPLYATWGAIERLWDSRPVEGPEKREEAKEVEHVEMSSCCPASEHV